MKDFLKLEKKIKINFRDHNLLKQSFVHRSYLNEHPDFELYHNERMELLGDAVLELIATEYLYNKYPRENEGKLTNLRASFVNAHSLAQKAKFLSLDNYLYLSKGESKDTGSKARENILANTFEALIGAIYLDRGYKVTKKFIEDFLKEEMPKILATESYLDPKSKFQEIAQEKYAITPHYRVISESGPDHAKIFKVSAYIDDEFVASGRGSSKQEAQINAAVAALREKGWG